MLLLYPSGVGCYSGLELSRRSCCLGVVERGRVILEALSRATSRPRSTWKGQASRSKKLLDFFSHVHSITSSRSKHHLSGRRTNCLRSMETNQRTQYVAFPLQLLRASGELNTRWTIHKDMITEHTSHTFVTTCLISVEQDCVVLLKRKTKERGNH